ncbi:MAG: glycosyltransferase family 4 protein [Nanoarchaeota archaeon]
MKIMIIGKWPPIQGGVCADTYRLAKGLGEHGHEIIILTNAWEVESEYRSKLYGDDIDKLQPKNVSLFSTVTYENKKLFHIPSTDMTITKLVSRGIEAIEKKGKPDLIYSYYFEPYLTVGYILKSMFNIPLLARHAGSDIGRLALSSQVKPAFMKMLQNVDGLLTTHGHIKKFIAWGVPEEKIYKLPPSYIPDDFSLPTETMNFNDIALDGEPKVSDNDIIFLMYGKVGPWKGTYDALAAIDNKFSFNHHLVYLCGNNPKFPGHKNMTRCHFVANWIVPNALASCDVAMFLERDFPIVFHGPMIFREILKSGTACIVSDEIAGKQFFKDKLKDGENCCIVNPKNIEALKEKMEFLGSNVQKRILIAQKGYELIKENDVSCETSIGGYLDIFRKIINVNKK